MQLLFANAKIMRDGLWEEPWSQPFFQLIAEKLAKDMACLDANTLGEKLGCSSKLAIDTHLRYQNFFMAKKQPAIYAYYGQSYKHLKAVSLDNNTLEYAQRHLLITSFLYGLLRPMDGIVPYRMEHNISLESTANNPVSKYWKTYLTGFLIERVKNDDGVLIHLSTEEYEHLFDWAKVEKEIKVIHPLFYVRRPDGQLKIQAVWAKSCRGAMTRYILTHRPENFQDLITFSYEGFEYNANIGNERFPHFIREL